MRRGATVFRIFEFIEKMRNATTKPFLNIRCYLQLLCGFGCKIAICYGIYNI